LKFEEDVNSVPAKKEEVKEEKKQINKDSQNNNQANKPSGGLKGLLSGSNTTNNDARVILNFFIISSRREDLKLHSLEEEKNKDR